jgi:hypothetical protein
MTSPPGSNRDLEQACLLLQEYSFELGGFNPQELVNFWQQTLAVDAPWIRAAVLEALYLGRYKAFSVEQILQMWKRRRQPVRHFNHDFERVAFGPLDPHFSQTAFIPTTPPEAPVASNPVAAEQTDPLPRAEAEPPIEPPEPPPSESAAPVTAAPAPATGRKSNVDQDTRKASAPAISFTLTEPADEPFNGPVPIQKFVPVQQPSGFYDRLQAVARHLSP